MSKSGNLPSRVSVTHPEVQESRSCSIQFGMSSCSGDWLCRTADNMSWECVRMSCRPVRWLATPFIGHTPPFRRHSLIPIHREPRPQKPQRLSREQGLSRLGPCSLAATLSTAVVKIPLCDSCYAALLADLACTQPPT
ncbi:hypothetical protein CORC01_13186 [Colletotrichum orchidophilum]|uniref:Uncharacterized protein n=1 Tax=Colletotrichum orchidophilum TaxID=1209926 RepID=A0A1G4AQT5_9PEZI|nr:uncharacterized protein CORC01_13186 [Colletotrichum orchidophilum]OHE91537.1 hypothetical protein CORC01_13186 [Colletotrichum orchidophilum]